MKKAMIAASVAVLLLSSACEKKVGGQVVAVVNGQEITQQELNNELNGAQIPEGADRQKVMSQLLQRLIDRKLLVAKAKEQGLDKSPAYLAQVQRGEDMTLIQMLAANTAKSVAVPNSSATQKFMSENPSLFAGRKRYKLDQIAFKAPTDPALVAKLEPAKTLAQVEAVLTAAGIQFQRGNGQLDTASIPPAVAARIANLAPGEPFIVPQNGAVLASVITSSEDVPVAEQEARPVAVELLRRQSVDAALKKQVDQARAAAKIEYQPGFAPKPGGGAAKAS